MDIILQDLEQLSTVAQQVINFAEKEKIWLFEGMMGAGKTTLIKEICKQLGVVDTVQSPTYSIVNEYKTTAGKKVYHFDFYRIKSEEEVLDIGYEDYFYGDAVCLVEWSSQIPNLIPEKHLRIDISVQSNSERHLQLSKHE